MVQPLGLQFLHEAHQTWSKPLNELRLLLLPLFVRHAPNPSFILSFNRLTNRLCFTKVHNGRLVWRLGRS